MANWLFNHPKIDQVYYPGLETTFGHDIAQKQMNGYGGVLSFTLKGEQNLIPSFISKLKFANEPLLIKFRTCKLLHPLNISRDF